MRRLWIPFLSLLSLCSTIFFTWAWYMRYLRWNFNDLGRYYDAASETVYTTSGFVWSIPAFLSALSAARGFSRWLRRAGEDRRKKRGW